MRAIPGIGMASWPTSSAIPSCKAPTIRFRVSTFPARRFPTVQRIRVIRAGTWMPGKLSRDTGARLGDFAVVTNLRSGRSSYAIFADIGTFGEGSVALAGNLGIWPDARNGGTRGGVLYLVFPGSGNRQPRT